MDSFDSLLTCCVCLDRYRNPKLLPCQHTFCMEPCMEGLIDYVKRQVKCPECRAEHRIPYKGIQEFPSNVTMQRFLEMYQAISGELPDPNQGQVMERCAICNEKEYLQACAHCDKKVCPDCKSAHVDVLKREVVRINNQVRRGIHKLYDILSGLEKSAGTVQQNCTAVREEVDSLGQRLIKAIRDRTEVLKAEVDVHMATEVSNLNTLKSNLQQEIANIESNSELAERHMGDTTEWDDAELMDAKDIFLKTVEFIRNFEQEAPSASDYRKPVRFNASQDPNSLSRTLEQFGELNITRKELQDAAGINGSNGFPALMPSSSSAGPGLMRSKSDHRLVAQLRQQEERYGDDSGRSSPVSRRRFGDRAGRRDSMAADYDDTSYDSPCERRHKYRSRFTRRNLNLDDDLDSYRPEPSAAAQEAAAAEKKKEREKVLDTEDASRGALSGIVRIADVPRVIQKLADSERGPRKREEPKPAPVKATPAAPAAPAGPVPWRRQKSEDDEIAKIKKQNKEADARCSRGGAAAAAAAAPAPADETPSPRAASVSRSSVERRTGSQPSTPTSTMSRPRFTREESGSETEDSVRRRPSRVSRPSAGAPISESANEPRAPPSAAAAAQRKISEPIRGGSPRVAAVVSRSSSGGSLNREAEAAAAERPRATLRTTWERRGSRSNSSESTSSASESSASAAPKSTGAAFSTNELKSRFMRGGAPPAPPDPPRGRVGAGASAAPPTRPPPAGAPSESSSATPTRPRFQSRFLGRAGTPKAEPSTKSESSESSSESDSDSSDSDSSSEDDTAAHSFRGRASSNMAKTSIGPLLARSALARKDSSSAAEPPATSPSTRTGRTAGSYGAARREASLDYSTPTTSSDRYQSRYSRDTTDAATEPKPYESRYGSSRYSGDYTPTNGLARSRTSSHLESRSSAYDPDSYSSYSSKYSRPTRPSYDDYTPRYSSYSSRFLNRDESSAAHHAPETEAPRPTGAAAAAGPAAAVAGGSRTEGTSRYAPSTEARRPGRAGSTSSDRSDGQGSGGRASPEPPRPSEQRENSDSGASGGERAEPAPAAGSKSEALSTWAQYLKNKYGYTGKDGERGKGVARSKSTHLLRLLPGAAAPAEEGATAPGQVAPLSADPLGCPVRSQYLQKGRLRFKIGCRGGGPGQLTWPRGIAVGPDNAIVVADSSNHRVQVFDQQGTFVKEFGQYGNGEAEFDCLAGVSVNRIGQFIISDRYNHRIQIFDPSGRFLRSFGQNGTMEGRFNYPWGVTTDALGFIYVCDKENHRVQVFQSDGTFVGAIGSEGHTPGQLAHPHYIAVSATNRVVVTDSNNHRVQVFDVNGKCLHTFGGEGGEEGKFKFPRGVAVDDQGYIIVGDSGNNRIQIFSPDGGFLKAFGGWGGKDGEFKGLEGVAVTSTGNVLVCDRENHRVQVF
ncbi:RING finger protein nhl-1-like isoform X2 [Amphibalanus amphitrite]|uniref:RING finger protein nhl-1-like isoform X2 n=1 Tax=Amphibalanus amphitrite TaxID=1232801 RepID=UPI001C914558|nr:RING finger protein nhl-1-like isoform X2 [Amphibalanus amphitrite]